MNKIDFPLHPTTESFINQYFYAPAQSVLFIGKKGIGKRYVAEKSIEHFLDMPYEKVVNNGDVMCIEPRDRSIGIDQIRAIQQFYKRSVRGNKKYKRVVVIESIDMMTAVAQNALLKMLEEPPSDVLIIATCENNQSLLATIRSRFQELRFLPPAHEALEEYIHTKVPGMSSELINLAILKAGGSPIQAMTILKDSNHELSGYTAAKEFLTASKYERIILLDNVSSTREKAIDFVDTLSSLAGIALSNSSSKVTSVLQWQKVLKMTLSAKAALMRNGNIRLVLLRLALNI